MVAPELCTRSAQTLRRMIADREVSCVEVMEAHLGHIVRTNPDVNAICTLADDRAREQAAHADARLAAGEPARLLEGLPIGIKDLAETAGLRTTYGSPIFADHVPAEDALHVARLRAAGAIVVGKTNTPEWGAGSQTFNTLFGATACPYDLTRTSGGSSGGAAAALAARMVPVADGSDLGGSLRNPAAFCNVVGLRTSPGLVPRYPDRIGWSPLSVLGPMAREVGDVALLLQAMAGYDPRAPLALQVDPQAFAGDLESDPHELRIAWTPDLGFLPVAPDVRAVTATAPDVLESLGCRVEVAAPDLRDAPDVFQTLRAYLFAAGFADHLRQRRSQLKDTVIWNTERGLALSAEDVGRAERAHTAIHLRMAEFFERYDFLVLPATQVSAFDKHIDWVKEIDGRQFGNYLEWMEICSVISLTGCPAISVPCGFTDSGLPVGLQIVAPPRQELALLRLARAFEAATGFASRAPELY